jgi:hypothetical protein
MSKSASKSNNKLKKEGSKKSNINVGEENSGIGGEEFKKLQEELAVERQERNYFQLERVTEIDAG